MVAASSFKSSLRYLNKLCNMVVGSFGLERPWMHLVRDAVLGIGMEILGCPCVRISLSTLLA